MTNRYWFDYIKTIENKNVIHIDLM
jgi:hypothetical protein